MPGGIPNANLGCSGTPPKCAAGAYSCGLVSTIVAGGYWAVGDRGYSPFQGGTNIFTYRDSLDIVHGKHDVHLGLDFRANQMNVGTEAFQDGFWIIGNGGNFTGLSSANIPGAPPADFLLGITGLAIHDQTFNGPVSGRRWKIIRPFIEDDWRVTNSLTLNLGIAYAMTTPIYRGSRTSGELRSRHWPASHRESERRWLGGRELRGTGPLLSRASAVHGRSCGAATPWFAPALPSTTTPPGVRARRVSGRTRRSSANLMHSPLRAALSQPPTAPPCSIRIRPAISLSSGFQAIPSPPTVGNFTGSFYTQPTNFKLGRVKQYNVNAEQVIPGNVVLTAGYAGSRGTHILVAGNDLNTSSPSACGTVSGYTLGCLPGGAPYIPPYGTFDTISLFGDVGVTNYDSLQVKAETKTAKHGLYALIAYTYSRTYDNGLSDGLGSLLSAPYFPLPNWQNSRLVSLADQSQ